MMSSQCPCDTDHLEKIHRLISMPDDHKLDNSRQDRNRNMHAASKGYKSRWVTCVAIDVPHAVFLEGALEPHGHGLKSLVETRLAGYFGT